MRTLAESMKATKRKMSDLEARFIVAWRAIGGPAPTCEFRFHDERKWRFDFAWPESRIAVEIEGGIWSGGRHTRGAGFISDAAKYNHAAALGWRVFRLTGEMIDLPNLTMILEAM